MSIFSKKLVISLVPLFSLLLCMTVYAQKKPERFSPKGIKASISTGTFNALSERNLNAGDGGILNLGYGFTKRFSLWLTLFGSEHQRTSAPDLIMEFSGIELNMQQKFNTSSRLQPYGKLGAGVYGLKEKNAPDTLVGAGINVGLGVDYFFAKHFAVGAEFMIKKLDYYKQEHKSTTGDVYTDLTPNLNGDTTAFVLTFTVQ